jgi:transcriptional regulator with XRE-family HTH domain
VTHHDDPLASWLRDLRDQTGLTQQELAEWVGVSRVTVSRWENGHIYPPRPYRMALNDIARIKGHEPIPARWRYS